MIPSLYGMRKMNLKKKDLKLKELNSDYVDSAGNRITNDDYDELELIAAKIQIENH